MKIVQESSNLIWWGLCCWSCGSKKAASIDGLPNWGPSPRGKQEEDTHKIEQGKTLNNCLARRSRRDSRSGRVTSRVQLVPSWARARSYLLLVAVACEARKRAGTIAAGSESDESRRTGTHTFPLFRTLLPRLFEMASEVKQRTTSGRDTPISSS